jgi:hypothetical protein
MERSDSPSPHISDEELARYLDRALLTEQSAAVESHLADCFQCREELVAVARVVRTRRTRLIRYLAPPLAAAAAAAVVLMINPWSGDSQDPVLRDSGGGLAGLPLVSALSPADGERLPSQDMAFVWSAVTSDARYRFTLTNVEGDEIWSESLTDTTLTLPHEINLSRGVTYFWYVDALLLDGRSVATGVRGFQLTP